jgi:serine/threonine protein kinase
LRKSAKKGYIFVLELQNLRKITITEKKRNLMLILLFLTIFVMVIKPKSGVSSICWKAPETLSNMVYNKQTDVWTFGIVGMISESIFF